MISKLTGKSRLLSHTRGAPHTHAREDDSTGLRSNPVECVYFEPAPGGVKMIVTSRVDRVIGRLNRAARGASAASIIAALVVDKAGARKLRRVLDKHWSDQRRGAGVFTIGAAEAKQVVQHMADRFSLTAYGIDRELSRAASALVLAHFAKGRRARWTPPDDADNGLLDELMAAGIVTKHRGGLYRGTQRAPVIARAVARAGVPARGHLAPAVPMTPITRPAVVPEPHMARELLLSRMDEAQAAGTDPLDVLHRDAYRGAMVNQREKLGGFAALDLDDFQQRGVAEFRRTGEEGQLGGAKAIDYEVTRVDSSLVNVVSEAGALARAEYDGACEMLKACRPSEDEDDRRPGLVRVAVAERMALQGQSLREVSIALGMGSGGAARERTKAIAKGVATDLARHFGFLRGGRSQARFAGDRPERVPEERWSEISPKI